ncbi:type II toxin-antitoxin system VapC family toxin [Mesorhizobium sp. ANAO-SY3R2]|uniref:type II toxin-antitoxin system VapC family toxin n=1 Tax=Mesorhizobium sp. ANAO-SY3R2 TaxID=3166644 RepID=UPI00366E65F8
MMFVDASVIVAIINQEPGWEELVKRLSEFAGERNVSPMVRFEAVVAVARAAAEVTGSKTTPDLVAKAWELFDGFVTEIQARELSLSSEIGSAAIEAGTCYGKVVGHPAGLNFGDYFAYACARALKTALLYKGNDFSQTDLA